MNKCPCYNRKIIQSDKTLLFHTSFSDSLYSILHCHLHCTHYILWTPTFLCDNSESPLSWFPPPAQPHPSVAPVPVLYVHPDWGTLPNSLTHRKRWSAGLNFHPSMWTRTQWHFSIRQTGRWSRAWSRRPLCQTLTVTVTLWACRRFYSVPYFLLFNSPFHLLFLSVFPTLGIHLCQFLILPPPKDKSKVGTGGNQERKKKRARNSFYVCRESSRTRCIFTTC